jgi:hypothetical protein
MVNGTWIPLISLATEKRTYLLDVGEAKLELKLQG